MIADGASRQRGWRERIRAGLAAGLEYLDANPESARVLLLEPRAGTPALSKRRQGALRRLAAILEAETHRKTATAGLRAPAPGLAAELVVGGVVSVLRGHAFERADGSFTALAPSLMSFISSFYTTVDAGPDAGLPVRATYRTTQVLGAIAARPGSNNREIADAAGLRDEGQTSKLLSRLERRGLIENVGLGAAYGEPNEWLLTASGRQVLKAARRMTVAKAGRTRGYTAGSAR